MVHARVPALAHFLIVSRVIGQCDHFLKVLNRPFPSCCEPHYDSEAKYKVFHVKISFYKGKIGGDVKNRP